MQGFGKERKWVSCASVDGPGSTILPQSPYDIRPGSRSRFTPAPETKPIPIRTFFQMSCPEDRIILPKPHSQKHHSVRNHSVTPASSNPAEAQEAFRLNRAASPVLLSSIDKFNCQRPSSYLLRRSSRDKVPRNLRPPLLAARTRIKNRREPHRAHSR